MNTNIGDYLKKLETTHGTALPKKSPKSRKPLKIVKKTFKWVRSHRTIAGGMALAMLLITVAPTAISIWQQRQYALSSEITKILSDVNPDLAKKLVYDEQTGAYIFNKENMPFDIPGSNSDEKASDQVAAIRLLQSKARLAETLKVGGSESKDEQLYSSSFAKDFSNGATYYDNQAGLSFTMIPEFKAMAGDMVGNRLVYPLKDVSGQAIYSVEASGVKEDVILHSFSTDKVVLSYKLQMAKTLEAKLLPSGGIGIYSADPSLFASNATSESADAEAVLKAQKTADKTHLVFAIPAPIVNDAQGQSKEARSHFELKNNTVDVVTTNLAKATFPLSIDPTIVVANSASFTSGENESNADVNIDRVQRLASTGGDVEAWNNTAPGFSGNRRGAGGVAYKGYMYMMGGWNGTNHLSSSNYAPINGGGGTGTWNTTTALPGTRSYFQAIAYNDKMYIMGGWNGTTLFNDVQYATINSDGTLGATWQSASSFSTARQAFQAASYNGFLYIYGGTTTGDNGTTTTTTLSSVQYTAINADGSLGSWQSTSSLATARADFGGFQYNGFLYAISGWNGTANTATVEYSSINGDGSLATWATTTSPPSIRAPGATVYAGYAYIVTGWEGGTATPTVEYAAINANGTFGDWAVSDNLFYNARYGTNVVAYNGYVYAMGGQLLSTHYSDVNYVKIGDAGLVSRSASVSAGFTSTRERHATAVYNGYVYVLGGYGGNANNYVSFCQYAPLEANGDITNTGWATTNCGLNITTARADLAAAAYNGFLYNFGGYNGNVGTAGVGTYYTTVQRTTMSPTTGALSGSTADTALPVARAGHTAMAYNGYMYIVGGRDSSGNNLSSILYATINSSTGALGSWTSNPTNIPTASNRMRTVIANGYMYVLGGTTLALPNVNNGRTVGTRATGAGSAVVSYAPINANGTVGTWTNTTSMIDSRFEFTAVAYEGYMYAIGGFNASGVVGKIEVAQINSNGSLGAWRQTTDLNVLFGLIPGGSMSGLVYNGFIYVMGGRSNTNTDDSGRSTQTRYIRVNNGGTGLVGSFVPSSNNLTAVKDYAASVYLNGYAYVIGGSATSNYNYAALDRNGSIGVWATGNLPTNMTGGTAVTSGGRIYAIGGNTTNVYYATPSTNGSIPSWTTATALPAALLYPSSAVYNGYIYVAGGLISSTVQSAVYYAQINVDGSVGAWRTAGNALPAARYSGSLIELNGSIYYVGGYNVSSQRTVFYSQLNDEGSPGPWTTSTELLPAARQGAVGLGINGSLYIMGGNASDTVYYANLNINGDVTPWQTQRSFLPATRTNASGVYANGYIYNFGGTSSTGSYYAPLNIIARTAQYSNKIDMGANTSIRAVMTAGLNADGVSLTMRSAGQDGVFGPTMATSSGTYDGSTTDWAASTSLLSGSNGGGAVTYNGYMYVLRAGASSTLYAKINADGTTGAWAYTTATPGPRQYAGFVAANGYLYVIGGQDGGNLATDSVFYAKINANGTVGTWSSSTLPVLRRIMTTVVLNGYVYVIGGQDGSIIRNTTYYALLNADGSVGTWNTTATLPDARAMTTGMTYNGYIYVMGGFNAGLANDVYYAPVNSNGTISSWGTTNSMPTAARQPSGVALNGYIYVMGGRTSASAGSQIDTIQYGKINTDGTVSNWVTSSQVLPQAKSEAMAVTANGYIYTISGISTTTTSITTVHSMRMKTTLADTTNNTRYLWLTATIDDSTANGRYADVVFGQLKGIYVDYRIIAPPDLRLRGGKYFEGNVLQPLIRPESN